MRLFYFLLLGALSLVSAAAVFVGLLFKMIAWPALSSHRHLLPATPRSIIESRRLDLA